MEGGPEKKEPASGKPEDETCAICGREAVMVVDGVGWCESCVHARGSCCGEAEMEE
ncbi:hypothetical protein [Luteolibacter soli]|uniref:Uncharacterized protein n=1 Tax=Luteolibacter soli TaxID=3135280 RepID=A0ABU9AVY6_9BACT